VLSRLFRRLFLERLETAHSRGRLRFSGALAQLDDADVFAAAVRRLRRKNWVVYAKPPFGSPEHVLAYLGRYTHRVAIANSRLVSADDSSVVFRWRDYRHGNAPRQMSLDPDEFIRRFLIHSLPDGFHRIRHYGFLANGCRRARLTTIRQLLPVTEGKFGEPTGDATLVARLPRFDPIVCPCCGAPCGSSRHYRAGERRPFDCGLIRHDQEPRPQQYPGQRRGFAPDRRDGGTVPANRHATRSRGRRSMVPDQSAGIHRNVARQSHEHRQLAAIQRISTRSAAALIP
jgi:hypothetical protein